MNWYILLILLILMLFIVFLFIVMLQMDRKSPDTTSDKIDHVHNSKREQIQSFISKLFSRVSGKADSVLGKAKPSLLVNMVGVLKLVPDKIGSLFTKMTPGASKEQHKSVQLQIEIGALVELAIEIWRIEHRINKISDILPDNQRRGIEISVQKLKRYLEKYDIEIKDYTNQKYNVGLNLDVLLVEKDESLQETIVKETVEPTIFCKGKIVKRAKVILLKN